MFDPVKGLKVTIGMSACSYVHAKGHILNTIGKFCWLNQIGEASHSET